jgi:poly-gamma-glutamate capsule biosynthesis protein CapA/YwtB (metallophosphatase superfamily)
MISIVIGGDICPMGRVEYAFVPGVVSEIFHDLLEEIGNADLSVANLEYPLISHETPIVKDAILGANVAYVRGFANARSNVLNLANNHSFDYGERGLRETIESAHRTGLSVAGGGENLEEAGKPYMKEIEGTKIVI